MIRKHTAINHLFCPTCLEAYEAGSVEACPSDGTKLVRLHHHDGSLTGRMIDGKYIILEQLGAGGMGEVYRARQMPMNREVAVKVLYKEFLREPQDVKRFVREASAASRMKSRFAVMIHDFGLAREGFIYLAMELAEGSLLSDHLKPRVPLGVERALHVAIDVCHALEDAHSQAIVHRDLKPGNIMLNEEDGHEIARVLDFGTARIVDGLDEDRITDEGKVFGTPEYMCPEQAMGEDVDAWADLYSLGIILYEMLTGKLPFTGKTHTAVLLKHINRAATPMREVAPEVEIPADLVELVARLMAKKGQDRPASVRIVRLDLEDILRDLAGDHPQGHEEGYHLREFPAALTEDGDLMTTQPNLSAEAPSPVPVEDAPAPVEEGNAWNPPTGEILELTSLPTFEDEPVPPGNKPRRSWLRRLFFPVFILAGLALFV